MVRTSPVVTIAGPRASSSSRAILSSRFPMRTIVGTSQQVSIAEHRDVLGLLQIVLHAYRHLCRNAEHLAERDRSGHARTQGALLAWLPSFLTRAAEGGILRQPRNKEDDRP